MLRSAAAAGADTVYLSKGCADAWSPKALRGGMGAQFQLALIEHADLMAVGQAFAGKLIATSLAASDSLYDLDLTGPTAFVFGNEGAGLSEELLALASHRTRIPMPGQVESLNAAAAAAICLFERVRQLGVR
jgi:TrmH family RNA methyltransferase